MRDIAVLIILAICIGFAMRKAWWGVLALAVFSYMNPHAYAWGFGRTIPAFQILFFVVLFQTYQTQDKQPIPKDWRIPVFIILWVYFLFTTTQAYYQDLAWEKFWFVTKIYIPLFFTLILINTRRKLFYLILTIAISFNLVAVKGGLFAISRGFSYRVYGPPDTQFYENNAFAIAVLMCIPLLILCYREISNRYVRYAIAVSIPLCVSSALSSWSRGGLLALGTLTIVYTWHSKRKYLAIPLILIGGYYAMQNLPQEWFARMDTIQTYEQDSSAQQRIEAWTDGWQHTLSRPFVGAGFDGWHYVTMRDWHNSYVEMFAEHGFIAFGLWLSLLFGTLVGLTTLPWKTRGIPEMKWVSNYCYMIRASLLVYMAGTMFLGLSYWDILYHLIFIYILIRKFALEELAHHHAGMRAESMYGQDDRNATNDPLLGSHVR
ncbi:MAG: putative O-glycosylation ligase, exosortase A system-associated [Chromatiaceae bacterium]|nr:putative O-glycosylation ligase, exosortase A system-associated [Chromatiaceae bacterium]